MYVDRYSSLVPRPRIKSFRAQTALLLLPTSSHCTTIVHITNLSLACYFRYPDNHSPCHQGCQKLINFSGQKQKNNNNLNDRVSKPGSTNLTRFFERCLNPPMAKGAGCSPPPPAGFSSFVSNGKSFYF